jgi:vacuolar protein sorting-associated protein 45
MSLNVAFPKHRIWTNSSDLWHADSLQRSTEGVMALLLSLKKKPLIRYAKNSLLAKKLATEVRYHITQEEQLFDFRKTDTPPILLIVDRRDDPVTPLLTQWTYQAMVHELFGIRNGRVDLSDVPDIRPEMKVYKLDSFQTLTKLTISCRKSSFSKTKILFSRKTCISISATLGKMQKTTSSSTHQNGKEHKPWTL